MSNVVGGLMSPPYEAFVNERTIYLMIHSLKAAFGSL